MKMSIHSMFLAFVVLAVLISNGCAPTTPVPPSFTLSPIPPTFTPEPTSTATQSNITIIEAPGNLESTQDIGCAPISDLKNSYTPPDLYNGMVECINQDNYTFAVYLFALAGTYSFFDSLRVVDTTAHDAHSVLLGESLGSLDSSKKDALMNELQNTLGNSDKLPEICNELTRIGAPQYYPSYMIQHGMNAIINSSTEDALVKNFDSDTAWKTALDGYLHCPNLISSSYTATPESTPGSVVIAKIDVPITVDGAKLLIVLATNDTQKFNDSFFIDMTQSAEETTLYVEAQIVSGKFDPFAEGISLTDENGKQYSPVSTGWVGFIDGKKPFRKPELVLPAGYVVWFGQRPARREAGRSPGFVLTV